MTTDRAALRLAAAAVWIAIAALCIAAGISRPDRMSLLSEGLFLLVAPAAIGGVIAVQLARTPTAAYRWGVRLALATTVFLFLLIGVGGFLGSDSDHPADLFYILVPTVGFTGAALARFQPPGMARALFATAFAQMVVPVAAVAYLGRQAPGYPLGLLSMNAPFAALFVGCALLFGHVARAKSRAATGQAG
jgi:hypothetical protein